MAAAAARRYARAIFDLAQEEGQIEEWGGRLDRVRAVLRQPEVWAVMANPIIPRRRQQEALTSLLPDVGEEGRNLARLLVERGRLDDLDGIVEEYGRLADEAAGRLRASVATAVPLPPDEQRQLALDLSQRLGREVRLEARTDPSLLGGVVVRLGDRLLDASLRTRLDELRRTLGTASAN
jgi:F-type H+-transporting ATPase subunit delta